MFNKKKSNKKKTILQKEVTEKSFYNNIVLNWCTGMGKTRAAINIIKLHDNVNKFYICVNEITHIKNWEDEFIKSGNEGLLNRCEIFCYASIKKYVKDILGSQSKDPKNSDLYFFILDEYHHLSEARFQDLKTVPIYKFIALSATGTIESNYRVQNLAALTGFPLLEDTVKPSKAIEEGILPIPKVYVIELKLDDKIKSEVYIKRKGKEKPDTRRYKIDYSERWDYINDLKTTSNYILEIKCTQKQKYKFIEDDIEYWKKFYFKHAIQAKKRGEPDPIWAKNRWLRQATERKRFIASCKTDTAKLLIEKKLKDKRYICFTGSIDQCKELGNDTNIVHSKVKPKDCEKIIFNFNNFNIDQLYCVIKLREGQNLNGIEAGLVIQLDNQEKSFTQELGRVLRSSYPVFYIIRLKGTRDDEFFKNSLNGFDEKYIENIELINE